MWLIASAASKAAHLSLARTRDQPREHRMAASADTVPTSPGTSAAKASNKLANGDGSEVPSVLELLESLQWENSCVTSLPYEAEPPPGDLWRQC